jgi:hypothetical protein
MIEIVVAANDIPRGFRITEGAFVTREWPVGHLPTGTIYYTADRLEELVGMIARVAIPRNSPILEGWVVDDLEQVGREIGSDAAAVIPPGLVGISIPIDRLRGLANAIQDGDSVDVAAALMFVDVDEEFQTRLPNNQYIMRETETEEGGVELELVPLPPGRIETSPDGDQLFIAPSDDENLRQRPRLVTQRMVQNAFVVHVANFPLDGEFLGIPPTPTPTPTPTPDPDEGETGRATPARKPPPTPTPPVRDIILLAVEPQDALLLLWFVEANIPLTLFLRSAGDDAVTPTDPVSFEYIVTQYNISSPIKLEYALEPPITSIRSLFGEGSALGQYIIYSNPNQ